jgi:hypothetical protein
LRRREDNIKVDLKEIGCEDVHRIQVVGSCEDGNGTLGAIKCR